MLAESETTIEGQLTTFLMEYLTSLAAVSMNCSGALQLNNDYAYFDKFPNYFQSSVERCALKFNFTEEIEKYTF